MSWSFYLWAVFFFTVLLGVFLGVAYSVLQGIRDNYRRYYQKADLQWTGSESRVQNNPVPIFKLLLLAFFLACLVVHFLISR